MQINQRLSKAFKYALIVSLGPVLFPLIEGVGLGSVVFVYGSFLVINTLLIAYLVLPLWEKLKEDSAKNDSTANKND
ncbi:MAG: hypothetical protein R8P61_37865 [Bacteroidia bacterium]|nr:hypothetical protein [Bacteroidia bacterium]